MTPMTKRIIGAVAVAVAGGIFTVIGVLLVVDWFYRIFGFLILAVPNPAGVLLYSLSIGGIVWGPILSVVGLAFLGRGEEVPMAPSVAVILVIVAVVTVTTFLFIIGFGFFF